MSTPAHPALAAIVGPTASGKSELAMALAKRLPVEIVVADSRQVYRGMDIGTAKPTVEDQAAVPHHLLDLVDPDQPFTVADWVRRARGLLPQIAARGRLPLVVGSSGLYVTALVDGFDFESQAWSPQLRARLAGELEASGLPMLAERLSRLAPEVAASTDLRNPRRVLRALERAESGHVSRPAASGYAGPVVLIGVGRPRQVLRDRIDQRARVMFAGGLIDEVRALLEAGYAASLPAMSGHGYQEAAGHLAGEWDLEQAVSRTVRRTQQYAKRQVTWYRRDERVQWLDAGTAPSTALFEDALRLLRG